MLINEKHNYIYVHVYKVAGQSVKLALRRYHYRWMPGLNSHFSRLIELPQAYSFRSLEAHSTAKEIREYLGPEKWDSMYSFSFVRNPWDWQVSLYHFIQTNKFNSQRGLVSSMSFDDYIKWRVEEDLHLQSSFIFDRHGTQLVDFVGRFENLATDFGQVCDKIGVKASLPHENASKHDGYKKYYNDTTAALIAEAFEPDIKAFGYSFE